MPALGSVPDILWIAGGTTFTVVSLTAVILWISREQPISDNAPASIPTARPLMARPIEPPPSDQDV